MLNLSNYKPGPDEMQLLEDFERVTSQELIEKNALLYITGYVAHRYRNRYTDLGVPTKSLPELSNDWICTISKENCMYPFEKLQQIAEIMNEEFIKIHFIYQFF